MLTATGELQALEISRDGVAVTVLDHRKSTFTLDGQPYTVRPSGTFAIPSSLFSPWNGATIDMPHALPQETQLFLLSIVLFTWDEANSAD